MMDPKRLLLCGDHFQQRLLRAGQADAPSAQSRRVILGALGLGFTLAPSGGGAAGVVQAAGKVGASKGLAALGAGAVGALALWVGVQLSTGQTDVAPSSALVVNLPAPSAPHIEALPVATPPEHAAQVEHEQAALPATPKLASPSLSKPDPLALELTRIDAARSALRAGSASKALRLLDEYRRQFPRGKLGPEATVLRIEAQIASGDRAAASKLGQAFLKQSPRGPYARRVRSLLGVTPTAP